MGASITTGVASAETQSEIANRYNEEGKSALYVNNYAEATLKFQQAVARVAEPKYFFNLCTSMFQEGRFDESIVACEAVGTNESSSPELKTKAEKLLVRIKGEAKAQGVALKGGGGGSGPEAERLRVCVVNPQDPSCQQQEAPPPPDPTCAENPNQPMCQQAPQGGPPIQFARGRAPTGPSVYSAVTPENFYTWTLGAELFGGGGSIGQEGVYGTAAFGLRIKGDYMLNRQSRVGSQAYLQVTHFDEDPNNQLSGVNTLDIIDLGIGLYKELCPRSAPNLCLRPLAGVQLSLMSPLGEQNEFGESVFNYAAIGGRLELGLQYAFGYRQEHVLSAGIGVNFYSAVFADPPPGEGFSRMEVGLDRGGAFGYAGVGYTYRFNTPLGRGPLVTLE
ncbi:MAG: hypothetical protein KF773_28445 [Deltaproteobacteria bacterium]|nr:hypothetical protein [Deltaproteobacteria bacterium]